MSRARRALLAGLAGWAGAELSHRWAAGRLRIDQPGTGTSEAIIVLGYPSRRNGTIHPIQRWRCQIALRSIDPTRRTTLIFTGAGRPGQPSEAKVMAAHARFLSGGAGAPFEVVVDETARSTWENIGNNHGVLRQVDRVKIASDPLHALRASRYLNEIAPDLTDRLVGAAAYVRWEHPILKMGAAVYEWLALVRRRRLAGP